MAHGMFPEGGVALVNYYNQQCNQQLENTLKIWASEQEKNPELYVLLIFILISYLR